MAIRAIINSTEKEIEQIKNSNEQDIDYVYSRIGDTEVEGEPPISIKSIGGNLKNYRIYGQTVYGESVGDKTENLFDETNGVVTDKFIKANGTTEIGANGDRFICNRINVLPNNDYIFSWGKIVLGTGYNTPYIRVAQYDSNGNFLSRRLFSGSELPDNRCIMTAENDASLWDIRIDDASSTRGQHFEEIMLSLGSTLLPYEPYGYKVPVTVKGKNLLPNAATSRTINGVTITVNEDGSIICNGTASALVIVYPAGNNYTLPKGTYKLTGCPINGTGNTFCQDVYSSSIDLVRDYGNGADFNVTTNDIISVRLIIFSGYTCNNLTFYPMIRKADIENDTYEPYHAPVTTPIYLPEQIKKVGDEAEYIDYAEQKMHRIGADDIDVTLPALSTIKGTNTLSVNTSIQPSNIYIKDGFDYKKVFTATRTIEDELPLNYRNIEDSNSTLSNYRIYGNTETKTRSYSGSAPLSFPIEDGVVSNYRVYGNTVNGESVGELVTDSQSEHYGKYAIPITNNSETANIYLDEPLRKVGDEAEYVDYAEQKRYNADGTNEDVTLPALPAQSSTNSLSIGTTVQPSSVAVDVAEVVSCGDKTVNILPLSRTPITETHGDFLCVYDGLGTITLTTDKDNAITDGEFVIPLIQNFTIPVSIGQGGTGCFQINNSISGIATNNIKLYYNNTQIDTWNLNELNRVHSAYTGMSNKTIDSISVRINDGGTNRKITIKPAFVENVTEKVPFEPYGYKIPVTLTADSAETTDIYLDTPLAKSGNNADYIDYATQKRHNSDGTESSVTLPEISTLAGTNTLTVGTEVQPSSVEIKGHIK